jgi:hypothetical protein
MEIRAPGNQNRQTIFLRQFKSIRGKRSKYFCPPIAPVSAKIRRSWRKSKKPYLPDAENPVLQAEDESDNRTKA